MIVLSFISWWYGVGWLQQWQSIVPNIKRVADIFSVDILSRTMFAPWKQIIASTRNDSSIEARFRASIDNIISRFVGFFVRFFTLLVALIALIITVVYLVLKAMLWPILPLLIFILPILAVTEVY